jgi:serine kinase of HPr protein (carbohydrate metabolism regulator)
MEYASHDPEICEHASAVAIDGHAVLLFGAPGCGKSDLALRLIAEGARLIADDQTRIFRRDGTLYAVCPERIAGMMEVRGLGLVTVPGAAAPGDAFPVALAVNLVADPARVERMPDSLSREILGVEVPAITVFSFAASASRVVGVALEAVLGRRERVN